jgi:hypothetical protein
MRARLGVWIAADGEGCAGSLDSSAGSVERQGARAGGSGRALNSRRGPSWRIPEA